MESSTNAVDIVDARAVDMVDAVATSSDLSARGLELPAKKGLFINMWIEFSNGSFCTMKMAFDTY